MGTWGAGISQNDTVSDIVDFVSDQLKIGDSLASATAKARLQFSEIINDIEEGPLFWIGLAQAQWKYGEVEPEVLDKVRADFESKRSLSAWEEDSKLLAKRKEVLSKFIAKIETKNTKLSSIPKVIIRKAHFKKGDCLSILLPDGRYAAAIVLAEDNSNPEYGKNLVGTLDYLELTPPTLEVFKKKKWLVKTFGNFKNKKEICWYPAIARKKEEAHLSLVGNINLGWFYPKESPSFTAWANLGKAAIYQREGAVK